MGMGNSSDGQFQGSSEKLAEPLKLLENAVMITGTLTAMLHSEGRDV